MKDITRIIQMSALTLGCEPVSFDDDERPMLAVVLCSEHFG